MSEMNAKQENSPIDTGKKDRKSWGQRGGAKTRALIVTAAIVGLATGGGIWYANQPDKPAVVETVSPSLPSENWQIMSQSEIQSHAKPPEITSDFTTGKETEYLAAVSPALQEKAKAAGYTIIYQGDPNDTTGRTILAKTRQSDVPDSSEDLGFGETQSDIKGVFKAWVLKPSDPQQKNDVYALLENPLTKKSYLIDVNLKPLDRSQSTFFAVDNLNNAYAAYEPLLRKNGVWRSSVFIPDDLADPNAKIKTFDDFPTVGGLLEKKNINLDNIMQPGDYIVVLKPGPSSDFPFDENRITRASLLIARRFGGMPAWESEVGIKQ